MIEELDEKGFKEAQFEDEKSKIWMGFMVGALANITRAPEAAKLADGALEEYRRRFVK